MVDSPCTENTLKVCLVQQVGWHIHHPFTTLTLSLTLRHHLHTQTRDLTNRTPITFRLVVLLELGQMLIQKLCAVENMYGQG